jgi:hypothetical protein
VLAFRRGRDTVAISFANEPRSLPEGELLLATEPLESRSLRPGAGAVIRAESL